VDVRKINTTKQDSCDGVLQEKIKHGRDDDAVRNEKPRGTTLSKINSMIPWFLAGGCLVPVALYFATRKH